MSTTFFSPGALDAQNEKVIVTETTVTQTQSNTYATPITKRGGLYKFIQVMSALTGFLMLAAGALLVVGAALALANFARYLTTTGILWIISFALLFVASLFGLLSSVGVFKKATRSPYHGVNMFGNIAFLIGAALMVIGAAFWIARTTTMLFDAGMILFIVGSSLILIHFALRNYSTVLDALHMYHSFLPTNNRSLNGMYEVAPKEHVASLYLNGIVSTIYTVASTVLVLGAICWLIFYRNALNAIVLNEASILWIIAGAMYFAGGILHIAARR